MGRRKPKHNLGRALQRKQREVRRAGYRESNARHAHAVSAAEEATLYGVGSVTETTSLNAFLEAAELAERDFRAERGAAVVVDGESAATHSLLPADLEEQERVKEKLTVPRRPAWTAEMSKEELSKAERMAFLKWRSQLAELEQNAGVHVTPFEKNIEMWRQLWRVVDRSHIVVQILDGRNPELFRCESLEAYVTDIDPAKRNVLLVNKADLVPSALRAEWAAHWAAAGIDAVFFSAAAEQDKLDAAKREASLVDGGSDGDELVVRELVAADGLWDDGHVLTRDELIAHLTNMAVEVQAEMEAGGRGGNSSRGDGGRAVVGLVGYPNVGKSSTINVLYGEKKTSVAATPGKTKHFQTLVLSDAVMLCDCPGLVFPSFVSSQAEMVVSGVLPIDNMRSYYGPVSLVCQRIPREVLEDVYGVQLPPPGEGEDPARPPFVAELLQSYAYNRGYMTPRGPDESRASRVVLKDYVNGKLLYCFGPNEVDEHAARQAIAAAAASARNAEIAASSHVMLAQPGTAAPIEGLREDIDAGFIRDTLPVTATGARLVTPGTAASAKGGKKKKKIAYADTKMAKDRAKIDAQFFAQANVQASVVSAAAGRADTRSKVGFASKKDRRAARAREKAAAREQERLRLANES